MSEEHTEEGQVATLSSSEELLTLTEALEFLGISRPTMYRLLDRGEVKGMKVGSQWRFRQSDLAAYLERGPVAVALSGIPADALAAELEYLSSELQRFNEALPAAPAELTDAGERDIARLLTGLLHLAVHQRASDVHLEPGKNMVQLRFRIDGVLHSIHQLPKSLYDALALRLKSVTGMDPVERRLPQDGQGNLHVGEHSFGLRAASMPSVFGEAFAVKLLIQTDVFLGLERLAFQPEDLERLQRWLTHPAGLILATGPSDCGKTTTLYSCLNRLNREEVKIMTVEDPVELGLPGCVQIAVNPAVGLSFSTVLRVILRQDPDILMIGEVRDQETLLACVTAALTGHLVFTALHTEDAAGTLLRLIEVGVAPLHVTSTVTGIIAQRLVRKLCPQCQHPADLTTAEIEQLRLLAGGALPDDVQFYRASGCEHCAHSGYYGRLALFELLELTRPLKEALMRGATHDELVELARQDGMHTLAADGLLKAAAGLTTVDEVLRIIPI